MKLTKRQTHELNTVLSNIQRAYDYINDKRVTGIAVAITEQQALGGDYKIINPDACEVLDSPMYIRPMNKHIGSDIAGLQFALSQLKNFIEMNGG